MKNIVNHITSTTIVGLLSVCSVMPSQAEPLTFGETVEARQSQNNNAKTLERLEFETKLLEHETKKNEQMQQLLLSQRHLAEIELNQPSADSPIQTASQKEQSEYNQRMHEANQLIEELHNQVYLVNLAEIAGATKGDLLTGGKSIPVKKGSVVNDRWLVTEISMAGLTLTSIQTPTQTKRLYLQSYTEAMASIKDSLEFKKQMIQSRMNSAQQALTPVGALVPSPNLSPTAGMMYE